ncbi:MAG: DUF1385 domain-containing protein [Symbiobacteriaceae bacterium]|nr:DUF1385 domain-containing protein [Symbiobacteriaceae bacterium]
MQDDQQNTVSPLIYGGQAVIEGVMMKSPAGKMAIACRLPSGEIVVEEMQGRSPASLPGVVRLPVFRGIYNFIEALTSGVAMINLSAKLSMQGEEEEETLSNAQMLLAVALAMLLSVGLFIILPTVLFRFLPLEVITGESTIARNLLESAIRLLLFTGYILLISQMKDIRRVFEYHGAEHKTIYCYEAGRELTPENAAGFKSLHPRCGTSFLLIVMVVSSLFFSLFGWPNLWVRILYRLGLLPLVAGVSYEILRLLGRFQGHNSLVDLLIWPGLQMQRLTTREPDTSQLEVAIVALQRVLEGDSSSCSIN